MMKKDQEKIKAVTEVTQSKHVPVPNVVIDQCRVFEKILEIEEKGKGTRTLHPSVCYEDLKNVLIDPFGIEIEKLCGPQADTYSYEKRWEEDWKGMLGMITIGYIKHFCKECYNCPRGVEDVSSFAQLRKVRFIAYKHRPITCVANYLP